MTSDTPPYPHQPTLRLVYSRSIDVDNIKELVFILTIFLVPQVKKLKSPMLYNYLHDSLRSFQTRAHSFIPLSSYFLIINRLHYHIELDMIYGGTYKISSQISPLVSSLFYTSA